MANDLLKGKKGIIFGALNDQSIAWKTALQAHAQGAEIVLTNAPVAMRMGEIHDLAAQIGGAPVIPADATSVEDLTALFEGAMEHFGGKVDFVLHSIGMSPNVRKGKHYTDINYSWLQTTLDVSAISLHKTLAVAKNLDAINEWGSVVALTYIAAQRIFPDYGDMADAKSLLESITRSFGYHYGVAKKVRVNTVSQSPTVTTAGAVVRSICRDTMVCRARTICEPTTIGSMPDAGMAPWVWRPRTSMLNVSLAAMMPRGRYSMVPSAFGKT